MEILARPMGRYPTLQKQRTRRFGLHFHLKPKTQRNRRIQRKPNKKHGSSSHRTPQPISIPKTSSEKTLSPQEAAFTGGRRGLKQLIFKLPARAHLHGRHRICKGKGQVPELAEAKAGGGFGHVLRWELAVQDEAAVFGVFNGEWSGDWRRQKGVPVPAAAAVAGSKRASGAYEIEQNSQGFEHWFGAFIAKLGWTKFLPMIFFFSLSFFGIFMKCLQKQFVVLCSYISNKNVLSLFVGRCVNIFRFVYVGFVKWMQIKFDID